MVAPKQHLTRALDHLIAVLSALRRLAGVLALATLAGAACAATGLALLGLTWWIGMAAYALLTLLPLIPLLRVRSALGEVSALPHYLQRALTTPAPLLGASAEDQKLTDLTHQIQELNGRPFGLHGFLTTLSSTRKILEALSELRPSQLGARLAALSPALWVAGTVAALWAAAYCTIGLLLLALGIVA